MLLPAPLHAVMRLAGEGASPGDPMAFTDVRLAPHYPSRSPLDDMLALMAPGSDAYVSEKYASEIAARLEPWKAGLLASPPAVEQLAALLSPGFEAVVPGAHSDDAKPPYSDFVSFQEKRLGDTQSYNRAAFLKSWSKHLEPFASLRTAEFEIVGVSPSHRESLIAETEIRFALAGRTRAGNVFEQTGTWLLTWVWTGNDPWLVTRWIFGKERSVSADSPMFSDVSHAAFGGIPAYREQLWHGVDHWRTVLDEACGIDIYGDSGLAAGDFDGDGFDDLYICQPAGLPNRLFRNRGDGTFEDVTEKAGVGVLDATSCAIFADFENRGLQDLLVVHNSGPLLFSNQGNGKFAPRPGAFQFATPPQGTFTQAAVADYDHDGKLDVYFCLYSYYLGLDQYHYPAPYFDARNGPANFLFHNDGNGRFTDRTQASGLNVENDRFSFACAWGRINEQGGPDLYVANDFGRSSLYRNRGDGTFEADSDAASANVPGAGMSACWADFRNNGRQDIYVSNMWSAAGQRVAVQPNFHANDSAEIRGHYLHHARGNSLYSNEGNGTFKNVAEESGCEKGRWAWSADSWDVDHDGYQDLFVTNGYISGPNRLDAGSFFWRQVVGNSPSDSRPSPEYERAWNAVNEWIRSDGTWNGYERNVFYLNNRDGKFLDVSGISGLDFLDDSRAFALADLDHDGRLEVILKNRTGPQIRVLRNSMAEVGDAVSFRLRGTKSNRDGIGASITVQCGNLRQTKFLQAGSGFLSQHSKELFFGLGKATAPVNATVRWPNGAVQTFPDLPINHRISITESEASFGAAKFGAISAWYAESPAAVETAPAEAAKIETWLLDPLAAPDFSLADAAGKSQSLSALRGRVVLLTLWSANSSDSIEQLKALTRDRDELSRSGLQVVCMNVDESLTAEALRTLSAKQNIGLPLLLAAPEVIGVYNILYRYLFDRRRDLPIPCSLLIDQDGAIVKLYQGAVEPRQFAADSAAIPSTAAERMKKGLPFPGTLHSGEFQRNAFTYGIALFQRGYLDQAAASFEHVIAAKPGDAEAHYNLGTLYLRKNNLVEAQRYLKKTVELRPDYPEAWNNLGMIAAQQNQTAEAIADFQKSLDLRPNYTVALLNLGNVYRRQGNLSAASSLLNKALSLEPENPEANYSVAMLAIRQDDFPRAIELMQTAVRVRPDYAEAWNNLGIIFIRQSRNSEAETAFQRCIAVVPNFDQAYLNLARLYALSNDKQKARDTLNSLLRLQPRHKLAQQALEMLN